MKNILSRGFKFLFISFFAFFAAFQYTWAAEVAVRSGGGTSSASYNMNYTKSPCLEPNFALAIKTVGKVISIIQIVVPILLVILVIIDIVKMMISDNSSQDGKVRKNIINRLISAIIIFFVIAIVRLVCELAGNSTSEITCLELISKPW